MIIRPWARALVVALTAGAVVLASVPAGASAAAAATVTGKVPYVGPTAGGTRVTISGSSLTPLRSVEFGSTRARVVSATSNKLVVISPAHAAGATPVYVTTSAGRTYGGPFTYYDRPDVTSVSPGLPGRAAGGDQAVLLGTRFDLVTSVRVGGAAAEILSRTQSRLRVETPPHALGNVDVTVVSRYTSDTLADGYRYAAESTLNFDAGTEVDPRRGVLSAVDCPAADRCAAVDQHGYLVAYDGTRWSQPVHIVAGTQPAYDIACLSTTSCLVTDDDGAVLVDPADPTSATQQAVPGGLERISCAAGFCVATASFKAWQYQNGSWTRISGASGGFPGCYVAGDATRCVIIDNTGHAAVVSSNGFSVFGGSVPRGQYSDVDCAGERCVAVGNYVAATRNGTTWTSTPLSIGANSVSCSAADNCTTVDSFGQTAEFDGSSWGTPTSIGVDTRLQGVSCVGADATCVAVDQNGRVFRRGDGTWSAPTTVDRTHAGIRAIACASESRCVAVDSGGVAVHRSSDGTWSDPVDVTPPPTSPADQLRAAACLPSGPCWASGAAGVFVTRDLGVNWQDDGITGIVTCARDDRWCIAVDGDTYRTTVGDGWSAPADIGFDGVHDLSCVTRTSCFAALSSDAGDLAAFDGQTWRAGRIAGLGRTDSISVIACRTSVECVGVVGGSAGDAVPQFRRDATGWHRETDYGLPTSVYRVVCPSSSRCVAAGEAVTEQVDGVWSRPVAEPSTYFGPLACPSDRVCYAGDGPSVYTGTR